MYIDRAKPNVVVKAEHIWIDGTPYDRAPSAENTSYHLIRENTIYTALGSHQCITKCFGLDYDNQGTAIALKTELASEGNLRHFIRDAPRPSICRLLEVAVEFARGIVHLHSRGVIWGDLSTRNALVSTDLSIKLCDFASSVLDGVYPEFGDYTYEPTYRPALPEAEVDELAMMQQELYALGSAVYEITEWKRPYAEFVDKEAVDIWEVVESGVMPEITDHNVAQDIILRCWHFEYESARDVADDLAALITSIPREPLAHKPAKHPDAAPCRRPIPFPPTSVQRSSTMQCAGNAILCSYVQLGYDHPPGADPGANPGPDGSYADWSVS